MGCGVALMWGRIKLWLAGVATAVAGLVALYLRGKAAGQKEAENKHVRRRVEAMKTAKDVRDEILDDPYFVDRAKQWTRKDD